MLFQSCTDQSQKSPVVANAASINSTQVAPIGKTELNNFVIDEKFLAYLKFAGSVEVEIFKIVDAGFKKTSKVPSQLNILSQLLELKMNAKTKTKPSDIFFNCSKVYIQKMTDFEYSVTPACEKNSQVIAKIKKIKTGQFQVNFIQSEWKMVIGDSALLNQKDKVCQFIISDNKLFELSCENTLMTVGVAAQLEEIKLQKFVFNRSGQKQITVVGGRFKDYLERSRINITVPETGKIDFTEEEILVNDEFEPIVHDEVQGEINGNDTKEKGR